MGSGERSPRGLQLQKGVLEKGNRVKNAVRGRCIHGRSECYKARGKKNSGEKVLRGMGSIFVSTVLQPPRVTHMVWGRVEKC